MRSTIQVSVLLASFLLSLVIGGCQQQVLAQSDEAYYSWPLNDQQCEQAIVISPGNSVSGSTVGVLVDQELDNQIDLIQCGDAGIFEIGTPGVWITYGADTSRVIRLSTCAEETNFANRITVFAEEEEGVCSSRSCFTSSDEDMDPECPYGNSTVLELSTRAGVTYDVYVHNQDSALSGEFVLTMEDISPPPDGTTCNTAVELPVNETLQGTTVGAPMTDGLQCDQSESSDGGPQNPGVFYYISPVTGEKGISLALGGAEVPFEIRVYTGASCDELECVNIDTKIEDLVIYASWLAQENEDFYVYVSAANSGEDDVTGRFGIVMAQEERPEAPSSPTPVVVSTFSFMNVLVLTWLFAI